MLCMPIVTNRFRPSGSQKVFFSFFTVIVSHTLRHYTTILDFPILARSSA